MCKHRIQNLLKKTGISFIVFLVLVSFEADLHAQITSTVAGGNWSLGSTWVGGTAPTLSGDVIIENGSTVIVDVNTACLSITINGTLFFNPLVSLEVNANWRNNGTFNASTGTVIFKGATNNTISGSSVSAFRNIIINKGLSITSELEAIGSGALSYTGSITFTSGLLKLSTGSSFLFSAPGPIITTNAGLWVNGGILNSTNSFSYQNNGLIRVSSGTANFGFASGNELRTATNGLLLIEDGIVNITGRLVNSAGTCNISGGTINVSTIGHSGSLPSGFGSFHMSLSTDLSISGNPFIIIHNPNAGNAGDINISNSSSTKTIDGGTFQMGGASPPSSSLFTVNSSIPLFNFKINNNGTPSVRLVTNNLTINAQLNLNGGNLDAATNNKTVIITNNVPSSVSRTNGHIIGNFRRAIDIGSPTYTFDIGTSVVYTPVNINFTNITTPGTLTGLATSGNHPSLGTSGLDPAKSVSSYWTFTNSGVGFSSYDATFSYPSGIVAGTANPLYFKVGKYNAPTWTYPTINGTPTNTATSITGINSFSDFAIAQCTPLVFNVTGGGSYCISGTGVNVALIGSQTGVNYQLRLGGDNTGSPIAGTGTAISFGLQTAAGTYTIVANNPSTICTATMSDSAIVTVNPLPIISGTLNVCVGLTTQLTGSVTTASSNPWVSSNTSSATVSNNGNVTGVSAGTAIITYTNSNGCQIAATITVKPKPTPSLIYHN